MSKHIHVHIHRTADAGTAHDPANGQFTTGSAATTHHSTQYREHRKTESELPSHHAGFLAHGQAAAAHGKALEHLRSNGGKLDDEFKTKSVAAHKAGERANTTTAGHAAKSEAKINANAAPGGATVASGPLKKGESVKIHPDHLESHEDPDDEYEVVGAGESPHGAVEIRSKKGLRAINQVHATSLMRHTPK